MKPLSDPPARSPGTTSSPPPRPAERVEEAVHTAVCECFQCGKCSAGCPVVDAMDFAPHRLIRLLQQDEETAILASKSIWLCVGCGTCVTRCPNEVDLPAVMDRLRARALLRGIAAAEPTVEKFHEAFLTSIRRHGRSFELGLIGRFKRRTGQFTQDFGLGIQMLVRGKLKFWPNRIRARSEVRDLFKQGGK